MSSFITKIEKVGRNCQVSFVTGETYEFKKVPAKKIKEFQQADSKGKFFTSQIRGKYEQEIVAW